MDLKEKEEDFNLQKSNLVVALYGIGVGLLCLTFIGAWMYGASLIL